MGREQNYKKKTFKNESHEKKIVNNKIIFFNMIYLMILFVVCFIGGILLGFLTTSYTSEINIIQNEDNVFQFLLKNEKIIIGGKLNIKFRVDNKTMLSYVFNSESVKYFYYPVGQNSNCLLYNGGLEEKSANQEPLKYKSEISTPLYNDEDIFPTKLTINVDYNILHSSSKVHTLPLHIGYEISQEYKNEVQPMYNDCKRFQKIYFSVKLDQLYMSNELRKIYNDKSYEFVFYCNCYMDDKVHAYFNAKPVYKNVILKNLRNNPKLLN
ncbi:hypothetical protein PRSY57_1004100 [Plasmodium reichenowi]|uniref:Transmembrane protein n=1 Tax=Plasmodium reichenowi TaxID=5854 RepID=A0A151LET9_PLARE|nr:hypothetical protein PRSY57_1004100 [Plasmodium reichenowi]KYN97494.1 hypothetical protein PRSY57_1004100 [Plasmodium reichenowi]